MVVTTALTTSHRLLDGQPLTREDYLARTAEAEGRYELGDGVVVEMGAESTLNQRIAMFLLFTFGALVPLERLGRGVEVEIPAATKEAKPTIRLPDAIVLTEVGALALAGQARALVTVEMPAPALVVEVVSPGEPGKPNYDRDYVEKLREYGLRGVSEYWIVDPKRQVTIVCTLVQGGYAQRVFRGEELVVSPLFPTLGLTARQVLNAGAKV